MTNAPVAGHTRLPAGALTFDVELIKILEPAKDAGMATLKVDDNIWNYLPKVDRTMKVPAHVATFETLGANPTPMNFGEVYSALQQGVIDGQENPYAQIASAKFQEVQKYLSITGHVYTPAYILASDKHFAGQPDDVKQVLLDCAGDTQDFTYETAAQLETDLLTVIKDAGVEVNEADKNAFIAASKPIYQEFASEFEGGQELIDAVLSLGNAS